MEQAPCDLLEDRLEFTASKHLWEAPTSVDFFRAWKTKPRWTVQHLNFCEFWQYARPADTDDFTKVLLTM